MKLYDHPTAPNPRRVHVFLAEKNIEIERINVDMQKGEQKSPEFLQKTSRLTRILASSKNYRGLVRQHVSETS